MTTHALTPPSLNWHVVEGRNDMSDPDNTEQDLSDRDIALMEWADEIDDDPYADSEWSAPRYG